MNVFDPHTWNDLGDHPVIQALNDPQWRDYQEVGDDPDAALAAVRQAACLIQSHFPEATIELVVLDSLDWMVDVKAERFSGDIGYCGDRTIWLRLDSDNHENLYVDELPLEQVIATIRNHFGI